MLYIGTNVHLRLCVVFLIDCYIYFSGEMLRRPEVTYDWKNITEEFLQSCEDLKLGELLHDAR